MQAQSPKIRAYQPVNNSRLEDLISVLHTADSSLQAADFVAINAEFRDHNPLTDRFVLTDTDGIIGYAWIAPTETIAGYVSHLSTAAEGTARGCSRLS